ncbi:serine/threonine-protein phosphatase 2A 55 kDa regulatory subunit B alpha isoform isoform X2 [Rhineura floridana]|uniref:serine/threonine-protein phosphatase 2A 55 kDa regulatory subunit B alpha isoform isoform X2 n=1 Tax=Rhineura floridana TaxID=261503 RepID=UPI002AC82E7A|nr:serine/threonine-protein phosphatase 2A 55 kDa regulatory subunit B alpha isoform isoform X2 [Rhineura floridana]
MAGAGGGGNDIQWCFSQVKGAVDDDVAEVIHRNHASIELAMGCRIQYTDYLNIHEFAILEFSREEDGGNTRIRWPCLSLALPPPTVGSLPSAPPGPVGTTHHCLRAIAIHYKEPADIISTVEFNHSGELLATGDKGGRVVIFQQEQENKTQSHSRGEYNVYSTFQSHEPEFDYLKSLEIEEKINKIRWLPQKNAAQFLLSTNDKTIKLWKISERDKRPEGYNLKEEDGRYRDPTTVTTLRVPVFRPMDLMVEASPRRIFANAHTYHINSISINSDYETYLSADDLRINLWHLEITDRSFNIVDIKPANMEELTEVITAAEFHPNSCNTFVYSSSKGTIRLCDMRASALCDRHSKLFEEPEDPSNRSFFSEIISSISDVKFSHSGRYMMTRDYLSVKIWDLNMENRPVETYQVHEYLRSKLCSLYENDCIFDKFECCWNGSDSVVMTGSYNNFFRMFDRSTKRDITLEASRENNKPRTVLKPRKVCASGKRKKDEISVDSLDFNKKILHTAWHPKENIIAVATTNNLYIFQDKVN